jgi:phosphatidylglycerophosphatase A
MGSAGALPLFWALHSVSWPLYAGATVGCVGVGVVVSDRCAKLLGDKDPSSVVIDEVAGVLIALGAVANSPWPVLAGAWLLFRLLDITKPWLIDKVQYLKPAGLGIMADDVLAGAVAGGVAWSAAQILPV